ncbi:CpaF family protein, partial [bacterium M00.F.Ca.ET.141.01.1.1]
MSSRFSNLQNRDALPARPPEPVSVAHHAVVITTTRKAAAPKPEAAPAKSANKVLDA